MWYNLAASTDQLGKDFQWITTLRRDELARKMTPTQIAEAQRMAREWIPKK
jgi:hypothetical protein